jgi:hypothetical protein
MCLSRGLAGGVATRLHRFLSTLCWQGGLLGGAGGHGPRQPPGTVARRRCSPSPPWHLRGQEPRGFPDPRLVVLTYRALHDLPGASLRSEAFCQGVAFKQDLTTQGFPTPGPAHIVIGGWRGWPIVRPERPDGKGGLNICENSKVRNVYNRFV